MDDATIGGHLSAGNLEFDALASIWVKPGLKPFAYSDGDAQERYLERVISTATDVSSDSFELERSIRDWPSEYHLTRKRAQLLKHFTFDPNQSVLEIGSGCGAITRFLGETFKSVVAVEGSRRRARIGRLRTRGMDHVQVVCAPLQELQFDKKFDIVIVVGVLEYAASFGGDVADPYDDFLRRCRDSLTDSGTLIVAIENQFGLKYFAGMGEDHTGKPFDGLEGYSSGRHGVRTFGRSQLEAMIHNHFDRTEFYYPFPDYKIPSAVLSESAIGDIDAATLVAAYPVRDYADGRRKRLFDDALVWEGLGQNQMAPMMAPSFLVVAGASQSPRLDSRGLGVLYSSGRKPEFQTVTTINRDDRGAIQTQKARLRAHGPISVGPLTLQPGSDPWAPGPSLEMQLRRRSRRRSISLRTLFEPCEPWFDWLRDESSGSLDGTIDGRHFDRSWRNTFVEDGQCRFIDQEWQWREPLSKRFLVIRSAFYFIYDRSNLQDGAQVLRRHRGADLIERIAAEFGVTVDASDIREFIEIESQVLEIVSAMDRESARRQLNFKLNHPRLYDGLRGIRGLAPERIRREFALRAPRIRRGRQESR